MTSFDEGELQFEFGDDWHAEQFDRTGTKFPRGVLPVDFIVEGDDELVLVEIKDPSAARAPERNREQFVRKMKSRELTHQELVPKARTSYGFLHLMARDTKRMRYVVVIGTEHLSMQPVLLANLTDMLRARLARETETAWQRPYVSDCIRRLDRGLLQGDFWMFGLPYYTRGRWRECKWTATVRLTVGTLRERRFAVSNRTRPPGHLRT